MFGVFEKALPEIQLKEMMMYETKPMTMAGSGNSAGTLNAPQAIPRLEQLSSELARLRDQAMHVANRTRVVTERLLGTQPENVKGQDKELPPSCKIRELEVIALGIGSYLADAHAQLDRLESL